MNLETTAIWRPDLLSLAAGLLLGVLLLAAGRKLRPVAGALLRRAANRLHATRNWVRSGVESRYLAETAEYVKKFHLGRGSIGLDEAFVEPRFLAPEGEWEVEGHWAAEVTQLHYLWPELARKAALPPPPTVSMSQLLMNGGRVLLRSEAGAGKTTFLAYCAHLCTLARDDGDHASLSRQLPALVHVAELAPITAEAASGDDNTDPLAPITQALQHRSGPLTARGLVELVRQAAAAGRLLLLLDGWDELGADRRPAVNLWLERLLAAYPNLRVIMAGSGGGYGPLQELGFVLSGIVPWRVGAAESLGRRLSVNSQFSGHVPVTAYLRPGGTPFETLLRLQLILAEKLQGAVPSQDRLVEMMELALRQALPSPLADNQPAWLPPASRDLWQHLAFELLSAEQPALEPARVSALMDGVLEAYGVKGELRAAHQLAEALDSSPLFVRWANGHIGFLSPLWRDYLAACYLAQMGDEGQIARELKNPYWQNALRFYVGRVGAGALAEFLGGEDPAFNEENLFQIASWMREAPDGGEWRRQAMLGLGRLVVDGDRPTALRQRAAIAMADTGENGVLIFLRQLLRQQDVSMRQMALAALMRLSPEVAVDLIERAWSDGDARIRWAAVHALAWTGDPVAERPLLAALLEPDEPIYRAAAEGLALNATETANEILREAAAEDALSVRRAAVFGLALLDHDWARELLEEIAHDDSQWIVKSTATLALETVAARQEPRPWQAVMAGNQAWVIDWALGQGRAVPVGKAAIPVLQEALRTTDTKVREAAARTLGQLLAAEAIESLQMALRDPAPDVRSASYEALWRIRCAWPQTAGAPSAGDLFAPEPARDVVSVTAS